MLLGKSHYFLRSALIRPGIQVKRAVSVLRRDPKDPNAVLSPAEDFQVPEVDVFDYIFKESSVRWESRVALVTVLIN